MRILLGGTRSLLCEMEEEFLPLHVGFLNDPEVSRFLRIRPPVTLGQQIAWLAQAQNSPSMRVFAVLVRDPHPMFVGVVSFREITADGGARSGSVIGDKRYWRRGIATEARILQLHYGFTRLGLLWVRGYSLRPNIASQKLLERVGYRFIEERQFARLHDGRYYDELVYLITKEEFYAVWGEYIVHCSSS